jgi:hypothetical protein
MLQVFFSWVSLIKRIVDGWLWWEEVMSLPIKTRAFKEYIYGKRTVPIVS